MFIAKLIFWGDNMSKREIVCPNCKKKVGSMRIANEEAFKCSGCKQVIEMKIINSLERGKVIGLTKGAFYLLWSLLLLSMASWFLNIYTSPYAIYVYAIQWGGLIAYLIILFYVVSRKRALYDHKELKLSVRK